MNQLKKVLSSIVFSLMVVVLIFLGGLFVDKIVFKNVIAPSSFGITPLKVLTGSMEPDISPGDIVVSKKIEASSLKKGDVISFFEEEGSETIVTHRIENVINEGSTIKFETKGDANNISDKVLVTQNMLIGKVFLTIPYLGQIHTAIISTPIISIGLVLGAIALLVFDYFSSKKDENLADEL